MGLYSSDLSEVGRLSNEAMRAARLVVDPGMHALGWTRQQAIDYMLENTSLSEGRGGLRDRPVHRRPAQAVSYMIGSLEIQRLRRLAEDRLGDRFDIRAFHDAVIEDGTLTLRDAPTQDRALDRERTGALTASGESKGEPFPRGV